MLFGATDSYSRCGIVNKLALMDAMAFSVTNTCVAALSLELVTIFIGVGQD